MRKTILLIAILLAAVLMAACGRLDVAIVEPTPDNGREVADAGATKEPGQSGREAIATATPTTAISATSTRGPAKPTAVVDDTTTSEPEEPPPTATPTETGPQVDPQDDQPGQQVDICRVRGDWPLYAVKSGDTLFRIALGASTTVDDLVSANCLANPDRLFSGQRLRVPQIPPDPEPEETVQPEPWSRFRDNLYQVSFDHPADWQDVSHGLMTRLTGDDGWVQLAAAGAGADLDTVAADQAHHKLQPYGSAPVIESLNLSDGRPARLILPSADQLSSMNGQAMIVAPYADPVQIGPAPHNYLMLAADLDHIRDIGASLTMPPPSTDIFIDNFSVSGEDLSAGGKRLTFRWSARGANRGVISSGTGQRFAPWWPVESVGELIVDVPGTIYPDPVMTLRMVNDVSGQEATATAVLSWACEHEYFFLPRPEICPRDAALVVDGAFQPFERGFMIWLPRPDLSQPSIYVFTNDGRVSLYPDTWSADDPSVPMGETPPEGLFEPVGGFAKVWREHPSVREDLGWGTDREGLYNLTYQAEARESLPGVTYLTRPDGTIVRLLDTVWQSYVPGQYPPGSGGGVRP